jgi:quercetin dioxygenase-like cupin family protein
MMALKPAGTVKPLKVENAVKTEIAWLLGRNDGAPNFEMRKFTIKPGGRIPKHHHPEIEHEQYVLKGRYRVGIGNHVYEVKKGDSIYIPAGTSHWYENKGRESAEFLCIVPRTERYDSIYEG